MTYEMVVALRHIAIQGLYDICNALGQYCLKAIK